jgi:hypothetical protein
MSLSRAIVCGALLGGSILAAPLLAAEDPIPASAEEIRPLLIGAAVPAVEVKTLDGSAVDLAEKVQEQPTVLIFYRGGW